jgi:predicted amidophosphoribosyltransferase
MHDDWRDQLAREGLAPMFVPAPAEGEELACPACGTAAPLVDGACSDCGLQLE